VPGHDRPFVATESAIVSEGEREVEIRAIVDPRQSPSVMRWRFG
jgi:hypothetical protein